MCASDGETRTWCAGHRSDPAGLQQTQAWSGTQVLPAPQAHRRQGATRPPQNLTLPLTRDLAGSLTRDLAVLCSTCLAQPAMPAQAVSMLHVGSTHVSGHQPILEADACSMPCISFPCTLLCCCM